MTIRELQPDDMPVLRNWLSKGYIRDYFGEPDIWLQEINLNLCDSSWIHYYIAEEMIPIGFFQYYDTDKAPIGEWSNEPTGTAGIDFLIGEESFLNKGYGVELLKIIIDEIKLKGYYKFIIADPDLRNAASVKVLEKCGFKLAINGLYKLRIDDI